MSDVAVVVADLSDAQVAAHLVKFIADHGVPAPGEARPSLPSTAIGAFYKVDARYQDVITKGQTRKCRAFVEAQPSLAWAQPTTGAARLYAAGAAPRAPPAGARRGEVVTISQKGFGYIRPENATSRDDNLRFKNTKGLAVGGLVTYEAVADGDYGAARVVPVVGATTASAAPGAARVVAVPGAAGAAPGAATGTVVTLNAAKGVGYVRPDGATSRAQNLKFITSKHDPRRLAVGLAVTFEPSGDGNATKVALRGGAPGLPAAAPRAKSPAAARPKSYAAAAEAAPPAATAAAAAAESGELRGVVANVTKKNFGFIRPDGATDREDNVFFAFANADESVLRVGAAVKYRVSREGGRLAARWVAPADADGAAAPNNGRAADGRANGRAALPPKKNGAASPKRNGRVVDDGEAAILVAEAEKRADATLKLYEEMEAKYLAEKKRADAAVAEVEAVCAQFTRHCEAGIAEAVRASRKLKR